MLRSRDLDFCYEGGQKDAIKIATTLSHFLLKEFFHDYEAWLRGEDCPLNDAVLAISSPEEREEDEEL